MTMLRAAVVMFAADLWLGLGLIGLQVTRGWPGKVTYPGWYWLGFAAGSAGIWAGVGLWLGARRRGLW